MVATTGRGHAMQPPERNAPQKLADYLEVMTRAVFQAGMSWPVVEAKWPAFRELFREFDPIAVATLSADELDAIAADPRIIRNRRKVEATVHNAEALLSIEAEQGFREYLRSQGGFEGLCADMRKRFKFLGDFGTYYFLYVVGEPVPSYADWRAAHGRPPLA
ncbi:MAG: DNA-3-methyladenine glycosylase I [Hyphomicrobiales bacterium]